MFKNIILGSLLCLSTQSLAGLPPVSIAPVGSTPSNSAGSCNGNRCTLQPADATHPGLISLTTQTLGSGGKVINLNASNFHPVPATNHLTLLNDSGFDSHIAFTFANSTIIEDILGDAFGTLSYKSLIGHDFYLGNTITTLDRRAYINNDGVFVHGGGVFASGKVTAGLESNTIPATLASSGSFAIKSKLITADYTATSGEAVLYCDTSSNFRCLGSATSCASHDYSSCPSFSAIGCFQVNDGFCSDFDGTNEATCEASPHTNCMWTPGNCNVFTNATDCGAHAGEGCTTNTLNCGDLTTISACNANAGLGCSTVSASCSAFSNPTDCGAHPECTTNYTDCSIYNGDSVTCTLTTGCSYNFGDDTCSGSFFASCSGDYLTSCNGGEVFSSCSGSYDSGGGCSGSTYGHCGGSASCGALNNSGDCNANSPCAWTQALTITLPSVRSNATTYVNSTTESTGWLLRIKKVGGSGAVTVVSDTLDTIEGSSSVVLSSLYDKLTVHPLLTTGSCDAFENDASGCTGHGCSFTPPTCGSAFDSDGCFALTGCSWDGVSCTGTYTGPNGHCTGSYVNASMWMKW